MNMKFAQTEHSVDFRSAVSQDSIPRSGSKNSGALKTVRSSSRLSPFTVHRSLLLALLIGLGCPLALLAESGADGPRLDSIKPKGGGPPLQVVRLRPSHILGTVNGIKLSLKDLNPQKSDANDAEQTIDLVEYNYLLNRALERETTIQAAGSQGIGLTQSQLKQMDVLRARLGETEPNVIKELTRSPESVQFELRDVIGLMLMNNLATKAGVPSPQVTSDDVSDYYSQNKKAYGDLPADQGERDAAWQKIDQKIRQKLSTDFLDNHQKKLQKFLDDLKGKFNARAAGLSSEVR
jgi:hypothetical protein